MTRRSGRSERREIRIPFLLCQQIDDDCKEREENFSEWMREAAERRLWAQSKGRT